MRTGSRPHEGRACESSSACSNPAGGAESAGVVAAVVEQRGAAEVAERGPVGLASAGEEPVVPGVVEPEVDGCVVDLGVGVEVEEDQVTWL